MGPRSAPLVEGDGELERGGEAPPSSMVMRDAGRSGPLLLPMLESRY